ncbi:MAG: UDP-N-acetylmuramate dehydrogenase [Bacteroidaceae bacterium]|nr:UDP-N-acetylmuramate dehydrogenase [Bacteroidaceae bacterium]
MMEIKQNISLKNRNTFGIDVFADKLVDYYSIEELQDFIRCRVADGDTSPLLHIGGGSNLLFLKDFHGTILHSCIQGINVTADEGDNIYVRVGAGIRWDAWVQYAIDSSWFGLENLSAIPGEVGASAIQNIGAYGSEAKDFILYVDCVDLETGDIRHFCRAECEYGYRDSIFKNVVSGRYAVTHVHFQLSHSFRPNIEYGGIRAALQEQGIKEWDLSPAMLRQTIIHLRQQKLPDPNVCGNAGSFFKNPIISYEDWAKLLENCPDAPHYELETGVKVPAAWLIEQCGWKGRSLGKAGVYANQPLVLVNNGDAQGKDIAALSKAIQDDVAKHFGITLETEVCFV